MESCELGPRVGIEQGFMISALKWAEENDVHSVNHSNSIVLLIMSAHNANTFECLRMDEISMEIVT